jgi:putative ABC transport system substrate-binding protein
MMERRTFLAMAAGGLLAAPLAAEAQRVGRVWRIRFLGAATPSVWASRVEALRAGLRDLGYVEGKNIVIEFRWANGMYDRLPDLAAELTRLKIDVLVTAGTPGALSAKRATTTIPIVMAASGDAIATGLVASLARPGTSPARLPSASSSTQSGSSCSGRPCRFSAWSVSFSIRTIPPSRLAFRRWRLPPGQ